jgi:hypothetical protein
LNNSLESGEGILFSIFAVGVGIMILLKGVLNVQIIESISKGWERMRAWVKYRK